MWKEAQYILARAAENFLESHINSFAGNSYPHSSLKQAT